MRASCAHVTPHVYNVLHTAFCPRIADRTADPLERLFTGNAHFANTQTTKNRDAFMILSQGQSPQILWIGCADSRIPETTVCHCKPGDMFVHRNIANIIRPDDDNAASVVEYAVTHLKVNKVVVCGHTRCGGAIASLTDVDLGETLNRWLQPLRQYVQNPYQKFVQATHLTKKRLRRRHSAELDTLDDEMRAARVAELNVHQSIDVLEQHPAIKRAMLERGLTTHGLIYNLATGRLKALNMAGREPSIQTLADFDVGNGRGGEQT